MPHIGLVTKPNKSFNQHGHACIPGKEIPESVWKSWMEHDPATLTNRLQGGWVSWEPVEDPEDPAPVSGPDINRMDTDALVEFAKTELDVRLDKRTKVETLRQQVRAMMDRRALIDAAKTRTAAEAAKGAAAPPAAPASVTPPADPAGDVNPQGE